jgi:uncharacterized protein YlbG (UPF0298 family)
MQVLIDIEENYKGDVLNKLTKLPYVKSAKFSDSGDLKQEISESVDELNLIKQGKLKGVSFEEMMNEL